MLNNGNNHYCPQTGHNNHPFLPGGMFQSKNVKEATYFELLHTYLIKLKYLRQHILKKKVT